MAIKKLLLVRGLGHSGTTILDLVLGAHPQMIGLGEAIRILRTPLPGEQQRGPARLRAELRHQRLCTCGRTAANCPIWGPLLDWLPAHDHLPLAEKLRQLLSGVDQNVNQLGDVIEWVVESYQDDLEIPLQIFPDIDVRVIFLVRDVRSWVHSRARDARKKGKVMPSIRSLARWCWVNRRFERDLRRSGKPIFLLGYEEFALSPERSLSLLCEWLGLDFAPAMLSPGIRTRSHILSGNRMRFDPSKSREIRYNTSWLQGSAWPAQPALMLPGVWQLNRRLVYSNNLLATD
ncbi:MAG TPA: sulfotransferase [Prochlorococcus sp.]